MHERRNDSGRNTTALMASVFVIVGGLLTCSFVALAFADEPTVPMTVVFVYLATVILLVWLGRERPRHRGTAVSIFQFVRGPKNRDAEIRYEPRRRRVRKDQVIGINEPPSVESVRQLSDNGKTWVPSERNMKK